MLVCTTSSVQVAIAVLTKSIGSTSIFSTAAEADIRCGVTWDITFVCTTPIRIEATGKASRGVDGAFDIVESD